MTWNIVARATHWGAVLKEPAWKYLVAVPFGILTVWDTVRAHLFPKQLPGWMEMPSWLPDLDWYYWALATLLVLIILVLEGSFRVNQKTLIALWKLEAARDEGTEDLVPDLSVKDLFFYLDPDCLEDKGRVAEKLGDGLRDRLAVGSLTAWGRLADTGSRRPLVQIDKEYWAQARLLLNFFMKGTEEEVHVEPLNQAVPAKSPEAKYHVSYRDLRFNKSQVDRVLAPSTQFVSLYDAARRAYERTKRGATRHMPLVNRNQSADILLYCCDVLAPRMRIYGEEMPSRIREVYSDRTYRNEYRFVLGANIVNAVAKPGHRLATWQNLCIKLNDLDEVIRQLIEQVQNDSRA